VQDFVSRHFFTIRQSPKPIAALAEQQIEQRAVLWKDKDAHMISIPEAGCTACGDHFIATHDEDHNASFGKGGGLGSMLLRLQKRER
jgi:hypothetical protein